jgi:hypothetical protein
MENTLKNMEKTIEELQQINSALTTQLSQAQGALQEYKIHLENALGRLVILEFKRDHKNEFKKEAE